MSEGRDAPWSPTVADPETLVLALNHLPTAVVLIDEGGSACWANDVVRALTSESGEGLDRLLEAVTEAVSGATLVGESGNAVAHTGIPTDRGLLERDVWTAAAAPGSKMRVATFQPDAQTVLGRAAADEQSHRLEAMLAHTDDLITLLGADGTISASNAAAGRLTGFSGAGVNGRNAIDFVHPHDVERAGEALAGVLASPGNTARADLRVQFADGSWHEVEASVTNLLDDPSVASLVISMHDVTDRRTAERQVARSEAQLRSLVENLTDVIVVLDDRFEISYATPGIEQIIDAPAASNLGMSAFNDVHPDDVDRVVGALGALAEGTPGDQVRVELRLEASPGSGRWRWIEATAVNRLQDPDVSGIVCTLRDVSEAKVAAEELRTAFDRLRELDTLKDQFLASVSHEMRTPLAVIIGFADLLERGEHLDAAVRSEAIDRVRASAAELRAMVENLLDVSALEAGRLGVILKPVRVGPTLRALCDNVRALLRDHDVTVLVPDDLVCLADHEALDRVMRNLLSNAAKYSASGRPITVSAQPEDDGTVRIDVTDEGVGIPADQIGLVFERLYRGPGAAFVSRGTGVGLNMVKHFVELMGGSVSVGSTVGQGSTFTIRLRGSTT